MSRVLTLGWLLCLALAAWSAALTPPAAGYELSLADAYPALFWALTIGASAASAMLLLELASREEPSRWSASGFTGIMATNAFVLSLPLWRGYAISDRADALHHIGYARDILTTGAIGDLDFYPAMHLLQVALGALGGMTEGQALLSVNITFALLWTAGIVLLAERLAGDVRAGYVAASLSAPFTLLTYHAAALPSTLSAMLMPILLALHLRRSVQAGPERTATVLAEVFLAFVIVYFHPITTVYTLVLLGALEIGSRAYIRLHPDAVGPDATPAHFLHARGLVTILAITLFTWAFSFSVITVSFSRLVFWLLGERETASAIGEAVRQLEEAHLPFGDLARILFNAFGLPLLAVSAAFVFVALLLWQRLRVRRQIPQMHFVYSCGFLAAMVVAGSMFLVSSGERHPIRLLRVPVILSICGIGWWLWEAVFAPGTPTVWPRLEGIGRSVARALSGGALVLAIAAGQLNVYPHPRNGLPNQQVTQSEISGMDWLIRNRTENFVQATILPQYVPRFEVFFRGYTGIRASRDRWWQDEIWLPAHFHKPEWRCLGAMAPGKPAYIALSDAGRISWRRFPASVRDLAHVYTTADWQALDHDRSVSKLYDSGSFEVWMTNGDAAPCG